MSAEHLAVACDELAAKRRGGTEFARPAAATLLLITPERLWKRYGQGRFEHIGVPDLQTSLTAYGSSGWKKVERSWWSCRCSLI
jgi:hypothetical protein